MANPSTVYILAREVYRNRNAGGAPAKHRAAMKIAIRPLLKMALKDARTARDLYRVGNASLAGQAMMLARYWMDRARATAAAAIEGNRARTWAEHASSRKKLNAEQERRIVDLVRAGTRQKIVASQFGVSEKTVSRLVNPKEI